MWKPFQRSEKKARFAHALAAFNISIEGYELFERGEHRLGGLLLVLAASLLLYARFHPHIHRSPAARHFETCVFLVEGAVLAIIALAFLHHGKHLLPWLYAVLVLVYLLLATRHHLRGGAAHARH